MEELQAKELSLIDVLREDDALFASSPAYKSSENVKEHQSFELLVSVEAAKVEDMEGIFGHGEQLPQPSEYVEPERTRKVGKYNLRKSLAWDSAFFTSAGVLEPEELSSMIEGGEKGRKIALPGIEEEDVNRSMDSISTLDSDALTLESLEADLFQDIRASIQKSSKASSIPNSNSKPESGQTETQSIHSSGKVDLASRNKVKPKPASKKLNVSTQGLGKMLKQSSVCPEVTQTVAVRRESTTMLPKLSKVLGRPNPISTAPTKRASMGANRVKIEKDNSKSSIVAGRGASMSKAPGLGDSRNMVPRPARLSKASSGSSTATKTQPVTSCFSLDSSGSASSDSVSESPLHSTRRKIDSKTVNPPSSGSTRKTPLRIASRNKTQSEKSRLSAYLTSTNKLSSSISPASSISEWSSESSSSTSTVNQSSNNSKAGLDSHSPCRGVSVDSDAPKTLDYLNHSSGQISAGHENPVTSLSSQCANEALTGTSTRRPASAKPSGLRMPSPKIGFFDGVKSMVRTPRGGMQSHSTAPNDLPKIGAGSCSPNGGSNKAKLGKLQPAGTIVETENTKPDTQQTALGLKPTSLIPLKEASNSSTKVSSALRAVRNCPGLSPKVQSAVSHKNGGKSQLEDGQVGAKGLNKTTDDPDSCLNAEENGSLGTMNKMSPEIQGSAHLEDVGITYINGDGPNTTSVPSSSCTIENMNPSQKVGEDALHGQHERVDALRRHAGAMDLNREMQIEVSGNCLSESDINCPNDSVSAKLCSKECLVYGQNQKDGSSNNLLKSTPCSLSPGTTDMTGIRVPFALKNTLCTREGGFDSAIGSTLEVVEKAATLPFLESAQKENS